MRDAAAGRIDITAKKVVRQLIERQGDCSNLWRATGYRKRSSVRGAR
jgi:hypothetical protein